MLLKKIGLKIKFRVGKNQVNLRTSREPENELHVQKIRHFTRSEAVKQIIPDYFKNINKRKAGK
jgi:hypothetical protein